MTNFRIGGWAAGVLFLAAGLLGTNAWADPIGGPSNTNCTNDTCQGATYTLSFFQFADVDPTADFFRVFYTIDTSTLDQSLFTPDAAAIDAAAVKIAPNFTDIQAVSLVDAPDATGAPGGAANWTIVPGGIDAGGCSGSGGGFECADWTFNATGGAAVGGTLQWVFDFTLDPGTILDGLNEATIKARYVTATGAKTGALVSEDITLQQCPLLEGCGPKKVPEPSSLALLGAVAIGMRWVLRRKAT